MFNLMALSTEGNEIFKLIIPSILDPFDMVTFYFFATVAFYTGISVPFETFPRYCQPE